MMANPNLSVTLTMKSFFPFVYLLLLVLLSLILLKLANQIDITTRMSSNLFRKHKRQQHFSSTSIDEQHNIFLMVVLPSNRAVSLYYRHTGKKNIQRKMYIRNVVYFHKTNIAPEKSICRRHECNVFSITCDFINDLTITRVRGYLLFCRKEKL